MRSCCARHAGQIVVSLPPRHGALTNVESSYNRRSTFLMEVTVLSGGLGHLLKASVSVHGLPYEQQFLASALALVTNPSVVEVGPLRCG